MKTPCLLLATALFCGVLSQTSPAATRTWSNPEGGPVSGPFDGPGNQWNVVPGSEDIARFFAYPADSVFTVTLTQNVTNQYMRVDGLGPFEVIFNLNGYTYTTTSTDNNVVGRDAGNQNTLTLTGGGTFASDGGLSVGNAAATEATPASSVGRLTLSGQTKLTTAGEAQIGAYGIGYLDIIQASVYESSGLVRVGRRASGQGNVLISGTNSRWSAAAEVFFGSLSGAQAQMTIEAGGKMETTTAGTSGAISIAQVAGTTVDVLVTGAQSQLASASTLNIGGSRSGAGGTATVTISNGGLMSVGSTLNLDAGGTLTLDGGTATARSFGSADRSVTGTINLTLDAAGTLAPVRVSTSVFLGDGTLNLTLAEGVVYQPNDVIRLLSYGESLSGTFANYEEGVLFALGDYEFIFSYAMTAGGQNFIGLTAVPEPGSIAFGVLGLMAVVLGHRHAKRKAA